MNRTERQIQDLIEQTVTALGCSVWGIEYLSQGRHSTLRVFIDAENGITVDDCAAVS